MARLVKPGAAPRRTGQVKRFLPSLLEREFLDIEASWKACALAYGLGEGARRQFLARMSRAALRWGRTALRRAGMAPDVYAAARAYRSQRDVAKATRAGRVTFTAAPAPTISDSSGSVRKNISRAAKP